VGSATYFGTNIRGCSDPIIWKVVTDELPRLKLAVQALDAALEAEKKT
jgi:uncharacterized protein with HEPN domain